VRLTADGELVDFGFVGDIDTVDTPCSESSSTRPQPVVSPLSADESGTLLNINADNRCGRDRRGLQAEKLILCTGAPGILGSIDDPRSLISYTDLNGLKRPARGGSHRRRHAAQGQGHRGRHPWRRYAGCTWVSYQSAEGILARYSPTRAPAR